MPDDDYMDEFDGYYDPHNPTEYYDPIDDDDWGDDYDDWDDRLDDYEEEMSRLDSLDDEF